MIRVHHCSVTDVSLIIMCTMIVVLSAGIFAAGIYILKRYATADAVWRSFVKLVYHYTHLFVCVYKCDGLLLDI